MAKPFFLVRVSGESMWPSFVPGKHYAASGLLRPRVGDDVVARNPNEDGFVVKKITAHRGENWELNGTVPWSSSFTVAPQDVVGVVLRSRFNRSRTKRLLFKEQR
jgi:hypothetical protein